MANTDQQVTQIIECGALGRSPIYARLLRYLGDRTEQGRLPKDIDIATDVFDRNDFDPASDSTVRVYLHNLRQKLDTYYQSLPEIPAERIRIPKGEYRLVLSPTEIPGSSTEARSAARRYLLAAGVAILVIIAFFAGRITSPESGPADNGLAATPVWRALLDDDRSVTIVVGDYYVFAEVDEQGLSNRLIRDFSINDKEAFDQYMEANPDLDGQYLHVRLSYLPLGVGSALEAVVRVLHTSGKQVRVIPQSLFRTQMLRGGHIVYVGYLSGMGRLARYLFAVSRLAIGMSYDELIDTESGTTYQSRAGYVTDDDSGYTDYAYFSTFPGSSGNQFLVVAGMRDEGLMRMASIIANAVEVTGMLEDLSGSGDSEDVSAFEALYEVSSLDRTHVAAKRLFVSGLDAAAVWAN